MREQTYEALKEIAYNTGLELVELIESLESQPWDISDKQHVEVMRLCLYYLHCPDELTQEEYNKAAEIYKYQERRWKIKIS